MNVAISHGADQGLTQFSLLTSPLMNLIPRYLPNVAFPPYTYVPGRTPHPISDPAGHMHGDEPEPADLDVENWQTCTAYLRGIDLFNHGYYWEAHESWEALWHAAGRQGPIADFLKGLIKLAAAGVKSREGSATGQERHAHRAAALLRQAAVSHELIQQSRVMGLNVQEIAQHAEHAASPSVRFREGVNVEQVFDFQLRPEMD